MKNTKLYMMLFLMTMLAVSIGLLAGCNANTPQQEQPAIEPTITPETDPVPYHITEIKTETEEGLYGGAIVTRYVYLEGREEPWVFTSPLAPEGWDPITASDEELEYFCWMARPADPEEYHEWYEFSKDVKEKGIKLTPVEELLDIVTGGGTVGPWQTLKR